MQPVRKVLSATHFKKVSPRFKCHVISIFIFLFTLARLLTQPPISHFLFHLSLLYSLPQITAPVRVKDGEEAQTDGATKEYLTPCSPGDAQAEEKSWTDVDSEDLLEVSRVGKSSRGLTFFCLETLIKSVFPFLLLPPHDFRISASSRDG